MKNYTILILTLILFAACERKPKACLALETPIITGETYTFKSCSENYEFLTWDFGDNSIGFISDSITRQYSSDGKYMVRVEAFSRGAYKSDYTVQEVICSHRYLDHLEIIGDFNVDEFQFLVNNSFQVNTDLAANGSYSESNPYVFTPNELLKIPPYEGTISLKGVLNNEPLNTAYVKGGYEITSTSDNPLVISNNSYTLKMFWKIRSFE